MSEQKPTSVLPKLIAVTICAFIIVISNIPPRSPDQNVELQIEQTVPNKFSLRYLFENVMAVALPSQSHSAGYAQWYGVLSMLLVPYSIPFIVRLLRERHQNGVRRYAQWTTLDRLSAGGIILGSGLRLWAFRCLGEYFTFNVTVKEDQPLLRTGPYKMVRHPGYAGLILTMYSLPIFFFAQGRLSRDVYHLNRLGEFAFLGLWVSAVTATMLQRITFEESCLADHFGSEFDAYKAETWRLCPFIY